MSPFRLQHAAVTAATGKIITSNEIPSKVYMDLSVEGDEQDQYCHVTIELATVALPKTCHNFVALCQDEHNGYKSTKLFKIEKMLDYA